MSPGLGSYVAGSAGLVGIAGALLAGGYWLRRWVAPELGGAVARLAELVLATSTLVVALELVGSFGLLERGWVIGACLAAGCGEAILGHSRCPSPARAAPVPRVPLWATLLALGAASVLVAQWCSPTLLNVGQGIFGGDATWYHLPFAARFAQLHSTWQLHFTDPLQLSAWFYPASSELLHSAGIVLFGSDWLSPLLNLGWLALAMLGGYCVGRPFGVGPSTLIASMLVLGSGILIESQAGDAGNDLMAIALLIAMAALLLNGRVERDAPGEQPARLGTGPLAIAGLAGGLAASVKLTMLAPVGAVVLGVVLLAERGRRVRTAAALGAGSLITGGYWYLRNLAHAGSPLPQIGGLGPIGLPHPDQMPLYPRDPHSVAHYLLGHPGVYREWIAPQLGQAFGPLFWLILGIALLGAVHAIVASRDRVLATIGAAALITAAVYVLLPLSAAGPEGELKGFFSNTRYLAPALALGLVLAPVARPLRANRVRTAATLLALAAICALGTIARAPWYSHYTAGAALLTLGVVGAPVAIEVLGRRGKRARAVALAGGGVVLALILALGRGQELRHSWVHYSRGVLSRRATRNPLATFAWARELSHRRIAIAGSGELFFAQYLFYGADASNWVQYVGEPGAHGGYRVASGCRVLRRQINRGRFDFLVISRWGDDAPDRRRFPIRAWVRTDPALERIRREDVRPQAVWTYRIEGRLDPAGCGGGAAAAQPPESLG